MHPPFPFASFPGRRPQQPAVRIGDAERAEACEQLNQHFTAGRLNHDELEERLSAAVAARTEPDLRGLFVDLPQLPPTPVRPPVPQRDREPHPVRDLLFALTMLGGMLAIPVVMLMLLGALMFSPGIFLFSLVGGSLAALAGGTLARMAVGDRIERRPTPPPGGRQPLQP